MFGLSSGNYPVPSFYFKVRIVVPGILPVFMGFQEVSGLKWTVEFESNTGGGENEIALKIPKSIKPGDVLFKRGVFDNDSTAYDLAAAFRLHDPSFNTDIEYADIEIVLMDERKNTIYCWVLEQAYPLSIEFGKLDAMTSGVMVENITFTCRKMILVKQ